MMFQQTNEDRSMTFCFFTGSDGGSRTGRRTTRSEGFPLRFAAARLAPRRLRKTLGQLSKCNLRRRPN